MLALYFILLLLAWLDGSRIMAHLYYKEMSLCEVSYNYNREISKIGFCKFLCLVTFAHSQGDFSWVDKLKSKNKQFIKTFFTLEGQRLNANFKFDWSFQARVFLFPLLKQVINKFLYLFNLLINYQTRGVGLLSRGAVLGIFSSLLMPPPVLARGGDFSLVLDYFKSSTFTELIANSVNEALKGLTINSSSNMVGLTTFFAVILLFLLLGLISALILINNSFKMLENLLTVQSQLQILNSVKQNELLSQKLDNNLNQTSQKLDDNLNQTSQLIQNQILYNIVVQNAFFSKSLENTLDTKLVKDYSLNQAVITLLESFKQQETSQTQHSSVLTGLLEKFEGYLASTTTILEKLASQVTPTLAPTKEVPTVTGDVLEPEFISSAPFTESQTESTPPGHSNTFDTLWEWRSNYKPALDPISLVTETLSLNLWVNQTYALKDKSTQQNIDLEDTTLMQISISPNQKPDLSWTSVSEKLLAFKLSLNQSLQQYLKMPEAWFCHNKSLLADKNNELFLNFFSNYSVSDVAGLKYLPSLTRQTILSSLYILGFSFKNNTPPLTKNSYSLDLHKLFNVLFEHCYIKELTFAVLNTFNVLVNKQKLVTPEDFKKFFTYFQINHAFYIETHERITPNTINSTKMFYTKSVLVSLAIFLFQTYHKLEWCEIIQKPVTAESLKKKKAFNLFIHLVVDATMRKGSYLFLNALTEDSLSWEKGLYKFLASPNSGFFTLSQDDQTFFSPLYLSKETKIDAPVTSSKKKATSKKTNKKTVSSTYINASLLSPLFSVPVLVQTRLLSNSFISSQTPFNAFKQPLSALQRGASIKTFGSQKALQLPPYTNRTAISLPNGTTQTKVRFSLTDRLRDGRFFISFLKEKTALLVESQILDNDTCSITVSEWQLVLKEIPQTNITNKDFTKEIYVKDPSNQTEIPVHQFLFERPVLRPLDKAATPDKALTLIKFEDQMYINKAFDTEKNFNDIFVLDLVAPSETGCSGVKSQTTVGVLCPVAHNNYDAEDETQEALYDSLRQQLAEMLVNTDDLLVRFFTNTSFQGTPFSIGISLIFETKIKAINKQTLNLPLASSDWLSYYQKLLAISTKDESYAKTLNVLRTELIQDLKIFLKDNIIETPLHRTHLFVSGTQELLAQYVILESASNTSSEIVRRRTVFGPAGFNGANYLDQKVLYIDKVLSYYSENHAKGDLIPLEHALERYMLFEIWPSLQTKLIAEFDAGTVDKNIFPPASWVQSVLALEITLLLFDLNRIFNKENTNLFGEFNKDLSYFKPSYSLTTDARQIEDFVQKVQGFESKQVSLDNDITERSEALEKLEKAIHARKQKPGQKTKLKRTELEELKKKKKELEEEVNKAYLLFLNQNSALSSYQNYILADLKVMLKTATDDGKLLRYACPRSMSYLNTKLPLLTEKLKRYANNDKLNANAQGVTTNVNLNNVEADLTAVLEPFNAFLLIFPTLLYLTHFSIVPQACFLHLYYGKALQESREKTLTELFKSACLGQKLSEKFIENTVLPLKAASLKKDLTATDTEIFNIYGCFKSSINKDSTFFFSELETFYNKFSEVEDFLLEPALYLFNTTFALELTSVLSKWYQNWFAYKTIKETFRSTLLSFNNTSLGEFHSHLSYYFPAIKDLAEKDKISNTSFSNLNKLVPGLSLFIDRSQSSNDALTHLDDALANVMHLSLKEFEDFCFAKDTTLYFSSLLNDFSQQADTSPFLKKLLLLDEELNKLEKFFYKTPFKNTVLMGAYQKVRKERTLNLERIYNLLLFSQVTVASSQALAIFLRDCWFAPASASYQLPQPAVLANSDFDWLRKGFSFDCTAEKRYLNKTLVSLAKDPAYRARFQKLVVTKPSFRSEKKVFDWFYNHWKLLDYYNQSETLQTLTDVSGELTSGTFEESKSP